MVGVVVANRRLEGRLVARKIVPGVEEVVKTLHKRRLVNNAQSVIGRCRGGEEGRAHISPHELDKVCCVVRSEPAVLPRGRFVEADDVIAL